MNEVQSILGSLSIEVVALPLKLVELQTTDTSKLVRDKCIQAFKSVRQNVFVEHTGLRLSALNGFPGGLTQVFWDTLEADRICDLVGRGPSPEVTAETHIAYCDGKRILEFSGNVTGIITAAPRGSRDFQWDCVFQPTGSEQTFAEMGPDKKNELSMRRRALEKLYEHLKNDSTA